MANPNVNAVGYIIRVIVVDGGGPVNISAATVKYIILRTPSGELRTRTASFTASGTDGKMQYTTVAGDLDAAGEWTVWGYVETPAFKDYTAKGSFIVGPQPAGDGQTGLEDTVLSSATAYCSVAEFLKRSDLRTVGQLASDTNVAVAEADLPYNVNVLAALDDASGMLESACLAGERYTPVDLLGLTGVTAAFLRMLVSTLAMGRLVMRRPDKKYPMPPDYEEALAWLDRLRLGERVFSILETQKAGHYQIDDIREQDLVKLNLATYQAMRLFGVRGGRGRLG